MAFHLFRIKRIPHLTISIDTIFIIGVILVMFKSNRILYARPIPETAIYLYSILSIFLLITVYCKQLIHTSRFVFTCICWLALIWIYDQFWVGNPSILSLIGMSITIANGVLIVMVKPDLRNKLLSIFIKTVKILVAIALIGWILFLAGLPMPHYTDTSDPFYIHTIYFLFNLNGYPETQIIPRFAGQFLEPGHCGTMCIFILYIEKFNLRKIGNVILLLGVLFSLSLAAYGLLVGSVILTLYNQRRYFSLMVMFGLFIAIGLGAMAYNAGDNALNNAIVARLEMDDDGNIAGSNRTSGSFDRAYEKFLHSDNILLGVGTDAFGKREDGSDNITLGCASYKRYFFLRGIIGSSLVVLFILFYLWKYRSRQAFGFFIVYLVANAIRDYPTMEMWMYLYLMAIPYLGKYHSPSPKSGRYPAISRQERPLINTTF